MHNNFEVSPNPGGYTILSKSVKQFVSPFNLSPSDKFQSGCEKFWGNVDCSQTKLLLEFNKRALSISRCTPQTRYFYSTRVDFTHRSWPGWSNLKSCLKMQGREHTLPDPQVCTAVSSTPLPILGNHPQASTVQHSSLQHFSQSSPSHPPPPTKTPLLPNAAGVCTDYNCNTAAMDDIDIVQRIRR